MSWCLRCDCGSDEIIRILFPDADLRLKSGVNVWVWLENESFLISIAVTVQLNELQDVCMNSVRLSSRQWGWTCRMFARRWISPPHVHTRLHLVRKTVTAGNRLQRQTSDYLRSQSRRLPVSVGCAGKHPDSFLMYTRRQSLGIEQDAVDDEWKYNLFFCISCSWQTVLLNRRNSQLLLIDSLWGQRCWCELCFRRQSRTSFLFTLQIISSTKKTHKKNLIWWIIRLRSVRIGLREQRARVSTQLWLRLSFFQILIKSHKLIECMWGTLTANENNILIVLLNNV